MTKTTVLISSYYVFLIMVLSLAVGRTLFLAGTSVWYGHQVAELEARKLELTEKQRTLTLQLAEQNSLHKLATDMPASEYLSIARPLTIQVGQTVAVRP